MSSRSRGRKQRLQVAGVVALTLALLSCGEEAGSLSGAITPVRLVPRWVEPGTGSLDAAAAWTLFDRDTRVGWTPAAAALGEPAVVTMVFDEVVAVDTVKVYGPSPYTLSLVGPSGELLSGPHDLRDLDGWSSWPLDETAVGSTFVLRFAATGDARSEVPEVELWGPGASLPVAWTPASDPAPPGLVDVIGATAERIELSESSACGAFEIRLLRHPAAYRRVWVRYRANGAFRPWVLTRAWNEGPLTPGHSVPSPDAEDRLFVTQIDPEQLRLGTNQAHFCIPGDHPTPVTLSGLELVAEIDHGGNLVAAASLAPRDGVPTEDASAVLSSDSDPVTLDAEQELVVAFERLVDVDGLGVWGSASSGLTVRCVTSDGTARELALAPSEGADAMRRPLDANPPPCAGLRIGAVGGGDVEELRVIGSSAGRRIDFPQIVLASEREHFGHEAFVDGWVRAPGSVGGGVLVSLSGEPTEGSTGVFGQRITRTTEIADDWVVTIGGRFGDGSTASRQFVLDRDMGTLPGSTGLETAIDDGLTDEERRRRFGEVGQTSETTVGTGESGHVELGADVSVDIPAGAVTGRTTISITHLGPSQIPALDPGLINVTAPFAHGYEMLPHGQTFDEPVTVTLPYQPSLLPPGYVPEDVRTFYFDVEEARWLPLAREAVERERQITRSLTDHFTVMIDAIVVAPEHPEVASFDPNRMTGIDLATPSAAIVAIAPPEASSRGDAVLSYPLQVPPGRAGMQPSLALTYNSGRDNGWLGVGWDLASSTIEVDTRWGVPRYDDAQETETYLLDGQQLSPVAHRERPALRSERSGTHQFRPRVETDFRRIIRHEDVGGGCSGGPACYWWEVTDGSGMRSFYGATSTRRDPSATLRDDDGNIFRWALREVRDPHGNRILFDYEAVTWVGTAVADQPPPVPGREIYLRTVHYTLRDGETTGAYRIELERDRCVRGIETTCRPDLMVSGRGGFKRVTSELLTGVRVYLDGTVVRGWDLGYETGPFFKTRLRSLSQLGVGGVPFIGNVHTFDYHDDVGWSEEAFTGFEPARAWDFVNAAGAPADPEAPNVGFNIPDALLGGVGEASTSLLGGSRTDSGGIHVYLGFNPTEARKGGSYGVRLAGEFSATAGLLAFVDIDGDSLPDRVYQGADGHYYFNRNLSATGAPSFVAEGAPAENLERLSNQEAFRFSIGGEGYPGPAQFHVNGGFTWTTEDTYLSDVNADGLVDLVQGRDIYFNHLVDGLPIFERNDSSQTPVEIRGTSVVATRAIPSIEPVAEPVPENPGGDVGRPDLPAPEDDLGAFDLDGAAPPIDTVRRWVAPYAGRVRVFGSVRLWAAQRQGGDGVRVSIEHADFDRSVSIPDSERLPVHANTLWSHDFMPDEVAAQTPSVELDVTTGDRIYFRAHSQTDSRDDRLDWVPQIRYLDLPAGRDENLLDVRSFNAASEFVLAGRTGAGMVAPFSGVMRLEGTLSKLAQTSDDVHVRLVLRDQREGGSPDIEVYSRTLAHDSVENLVLDRDFAVSAGRYVALVVRSDSPIDLTALGFLPRERPDGVERGGLWLTYVSAVDETGSPVRVTDHRGWPVPEIPLPPDITTYSERIPAVPAPSFVVPGMGEIIGTVTLNSLAPIGGTITVAAKSRGHLLGKQQVVIAPGDSLFTSFPIDVMADSEVFISFTADDPRLLEWIVTMAQFRDGASTSLVPSIQYGPEQLSRISARYRGWSFVGYNGGGSRGSDPIESRALEQQETSFDATDTADGSNVRDLSDRFRDDEQLVFVMVPFGDAPRCLFGPDSPLECGTARGAHWVGPDDGVYLAGAEVSTSRIGGDGARLPRPEELSGAQAVARFTFSSNAAFGAGVGSSGVSGSISAAFGFGHGQVDYFDINGDGFPDVLGPERAQVTTPLGLLDADAAHDVLVPAGDVHHTETQSITAGISGGISEASFGSRAQAGTASVRAAAGSSAGTQEPTLGVSLEIAGGHATTTHDYLDVNGDGLPDRVHGTGGAGTLLVSLNLGTHFAPEEPWGVASVHEGWSQDVSGGGSLSFQSDAYEYGGGVNANKNTSSIRPTDLTDLFGAQAGAVLLDINGDGMLDRVSVHESGDFTVWFNTGHGFQSTPIRWGGTVGDIEQNDSTSFSGGGYFSIGIGPLCVPSSNCYLIINVGANGGQTVSRPVAAVRDIDGDGYPDHLVSGDPGEVRVARNRTARTNLLRTVHRPMHAQIDIDYERVGNTQVNPHSQWVLSDVQVFDGLVDAPEGQSPNDHVVQHFSYEGGRFDRFEREFYGFSRVGIDEVDTRGWDGVAGEPFARDRPVYRRTELTFLNERYAERGLQIERRLLDATGALFARFENTFELRDATTGAVVPEEELAAAASVFPALIRVETAQHEGNPSEFVQSTTTQDYDLFGNVTRFVDLGGPGSGDDLVATIDYTSSELGCRSNYIVALAKRIEVTDASGTAQLRRREATIDCAFGDVTQLRTTLNGTQVATTDLGYDSDGNLSYVVQPPNHRGQRYRLDFQYDPRVQTHVTRVDDSFGYFSTTTYDLAFGAPTSEKDINGAEVTTQYDPFGRVQQIRGPLERDYTIRFGYNPRARVPFATTTQFDAFRGDDPIDNVVFQDGLGRPLQSKRDATVHRTDVPGSAEDVMVVSGRTHFDPWGRVVATWHQTEEPKDPSLNRALRPDIDGSVPPSTITYDIVDRAIHTVLPDGSITRQEFALVPAISGSGLWIRARAIDDLNRLSDGLRDARNRIRAVVEHHDGRELVTRYEYDPLNQLRTVTDVTGNQTRVTYDLAGRQTSMESPDSGRTDVAYDPAGNPIRRITPNLRARSEAIALRYDFTQLVAIDYPVDAIDVAYTWGGAALRGTGGFRAGRLVRVDDGTGHEERRYDAIGQMMQEVRTVESPRGGAGSEPQVFTTGFLYDTWGRLQQMRYPDGEALTYAYDSGGRVRSATGIKLGETFEYVTRMEYDRFEQRVFMQTGNGIRTHYTYEPELRRLETLVAGDFQSLTYAYDAVGNITGLENDLTGARSDRYGGRVEQSFRYDDLDRLIGANGEWTSPRGGLETYDVTQSYSDIHTLVSKAQEHTARNGARGRPVIQHETTYSQAYRYDGPRPHAPTRIGERERTYDANGNLTFVRQPRSGLRRTLRWDAENRVESISDNGRTTDFVYDDQGRRVLKIGAQGETLYANQFWTVRNGRIGTKHIFVGTTRVASKLSPGGAHLRPDPADDVSVMLGRWWEHRSASGFVHARDVEMNPHYRVPSTLPETGTPETNFVYFFHPDHLGSTQYVTDADGELYEHVQYFPSGEPWIHQDSNTERLPYLFTSQELDQETQLYYMGARYYDPRDGVFVSPDPAYPNYIRGSPNGGVFQPGNLQTYCYAWNNPLTVSDPSGACPLCVAVVVGATLAAWVFPTSAGDPEPGRHRRSEGASYAHMAVGGVAPTSMEAGFAAGVATVAIEDVDRGERSPGSDYVVAGMAGAASNAGSELVGIALRRGGRSVVVETARRLVRDTEGSTGAAGGAGRSLDDLSRAAGAADRGGLTVAGRSLQKHGGRTGSAFPTARGNPARINRAAQDIVDDILTHPGSTSTVRQTGRFGEVLDIVDPTGRGVRFSSEGRFLHFLEP